VEFLNQIFMMFSKGGLVMYPLLICSVIVVAIAIERGLYFRHGETDVKALLGVLDEQLNKGNWDGVREVCTNSKGIAAEMLANALQQKSEDHMQLEQNFDRVATIVATALRYRLDFLDTIVTLAPLLGLLGTVTGMIQSFSVFAIKGSQPLAITGGVGEALIATATGLCVAILALLIHSYFSHHVNAIISDMEHLSSYVLSMSSRRGLTEGLNEAK